jgi:hypothetical protein
MTVHALRGKHKKMSKPEKIVGGAGVSSDLSLASGTA